MADIKLNFKYISEASIKSQSKYLFGTHAPSLAKAFMRCLNTDGDGKVDFEEFRVIMDIILDERSFNQNKSKWVKLLFNLFDKDEDGILTWNDLSEMASSRMFKIDHMLEEIYAFVIEFLNIQLVNNSNTDTTNTNEVMN